TIIPGETQPTLTATQTGDYRVEIEIPLAGSTCLIEDTVNVILSSTQAAGAIPDYELCDDISADEIETFDLSTMDADALAAVPPSSYTVSYHTSATDATNGINAISGTIQNTSNPQTIFVRIEDDINGCLAFQTFNLIVNPLPQIITPTPLITCDDSIADGSTTIDLSQKNDEITNSNPNYNVTYHSTPIDATNGTNALPFPYVNIQPNETVYVNVTDLNTGCSITTSLDIEVRDNPVINTENHYIDACDSDHDGFATFDLTSIIDDVLEGLTGVNVTFHETQDDANLGINPIINVTNYANNQVNEQTLFIRVEDAVTGCVSTTPIEVHTNLLLTGGDIRDLFICDELNDGIEEIFLLEATGGFLGDIEDVMEYNVDLEFYLTESDRDNMINAIDTSVPFIPTSNPQTLYITITSPFCQEVSEFNIHLNPIIEFDPIADQTVCDFDQDGITVIDLSFYDALITNNQTDDFTVTYFESEDDANNNNNILPTFYTNISNPQMIYASISPNTTSCADIIAFEIEVLPAPISNQPASIIICDDDQDGVFIVDLESTIPELVPDTTDRAITYYNSQIDANNSTNPILTPTSYAAATETVYARIENTITGCYSTETLEIIVNTLPQFIAITNYRICEDASDDIADFIFETKDAEILNGQIGKEVLYFESQFDADNNTNVIDKTVAYQNTSNPQTIYVRVQNLTDPNCYDTTSFIIEVGTNPVFNGPTDWFVCDDISNDGSELFDLNIKAQEMAQGINDTLDITFYLTMNDAENLTNPIPFQFENTVNPQQIFAVIDNGTICNSITSFELNVIQVPEANLAAPLVACDDDYDGLVTFDLTISELEVLDVRQDNIVVSYFETMADLEADTNPITNPNAYTNISNPQTVFIKITNTISNCFVAIPLDLIVNLPPVINDFQSYEICENATNSFDLNEIISVALDDTNDKSISFYSTQADAETMTNALNTNYTYSTTNDTIFIRVSFNSTLCYAIYGFNLTVNPSPIANQPADLQACDDISNDNTAIFSLYSQNPEILGTQSNVDYSVNYFVTLTDAENDTNPLANDYLGQQGQTIYARVENNTTGCFSITQFNLIVNPHPNTPNTLQTCDDDYDGLSQFDLTLAESELFANPIPDNVITYFETLDDLNADTNTIANPTAFQNTSNPQTVYIKVYNQVADCFTYVDLNLDVNLPPAINNLSVFEICDTATGTVDLSTINSDLLSNHDGRAK
ncbi:MAG: hypothetical protein JJ936_11505, partial [Psychroserpens sp.]|nr:hypothetical protein [Psychroserpens sp.]